MLLRYPRQTCSQCMGMIHIGLIMDILFPMLPSLPIFRSMGHSMANGPMDEFC